MVNNQSYKQYRKEFIKDWACKISRRFGCEPGKGGRGKKDNLLGRLVDSLHLSYDTWQKYQAGKYAPNDDRMAIMNKRAIQLGLIGQGHSLKSIQERSGMMIQDEWDFWMNQTNPSFQFEDEEQELSEKALKLEQQAAELFSEAQAIRRYLREL